MAKMTKSEINRYGMSTADIQEQYVQSFTASCSGLEMVVMGVLSDAQEMLGQGAGPNSIGYARKQLNIAKYILQEMMEAKMARPFKETV